MPVDFSKVKLVKPLIGDGCEKLYIYRADNDGDGVAVLLRPMTGDEAEQFLATDGPLLERVKPEFEKRVKGWNVADPVMPGRLAPVTAAVFAQLPHPVQKWVSNCLTGYHRSADPAELTPADEAKN